MNVQEASAAVAKQLQAIGSAQGLPPARLLLAFLQAGGESSFGLGWKGDGKGSFNLGAITGVGPNGYFIYGDSMPDPKQPGKVKSYTTKFRKYHGWTDAVTDLLRWTSKLGVSQAAANGSLQQYCAALYNGGYYLGTSHVPAQNVQKYCIMLQRQRRYYDALQTWGPGKALLYDWDATPTNESAAAAWTTLFGAQPFRVRGAKTVLDAAPAARASTTGSTSSGSGPVRRIIRYVLEPLPTGQAIPKGHYWLEKRGAVFSEWRRA